MASVKKMSPVQNYLRNFNRLPSPADTYSPVIVDNMAKSRTNSGIHDTKTRCKYDQHMLSVNIHIKKYCTIHK
jgi:hypothetical protein